MLAVAATGRKAFLCIFIFTKSASLKNEADFFFIFITPITMTTMNTPNPKDIKNKSEDEQIKWMQKKFQTVTFSGRDQQEIQFCEMFGRLSNGEWINISILNHSENFANKVKQIFN